MNRTALVLSGGGSRGGYEIGVWKALNKLGIEIDMVMGTSVGAINGAMIAQGNRKLAEKLWQELETDMVFDIDDTAKEAVPEKLASLDIGGMPAGDALAYAKEIITGGGAGSSGLRSMLDTYVDETGVRNSKITYGLVTTEYPSLEARYLFVEDIPRGRLNDFILASASCFPAVQKCVIDDKEYIDGGYRDNLPVSMAVEKGADSIIAVDLQAAGFVRKSDIEEAKNRMSSFRLIKSSLDLGSFLVFDRKNTARIIQLGYLDTMRSFGRYDGSRYTFKKNSFSSHDLEGADNAAYILELDPTEIYTKKSILRAVHEAIISINTTDYLPEGIDDIKAVFRDFRDFSIKDFVDDYAGKGTLLKFIAEDLEKKEADSIFMQPAVFKMMSPYVKAANFIIKYDLNHQVSYR